jgi:glycosyltransferase involved in cell wall biosynthesis
MSSHSEGFPLALLEAGNLGKPIICSDIEIFRELFSDDEVCFFKLNDIKSLVNSVLQIENNLEFYSKNINSVITNKYSSINMANNYMNLYSSVLNIKNI